MKNVVETMKMLAKSDYKQVAVVVKNIKFINGYSDSVVNELSNQDLSFLYKVTSQSIKLLGTKFYFFDESSPDRLRGPQFDAAIVQGGFTNTAVEANLKLVLRPLRLGDNPILIHV